ncbi:MAG TPA: helix-turn-helix transcriptional regulator [Thermoanaerobaculia bacterium]|nr:helix-turn-helix transcriptional regulator [Thermoanaerobaculia bacterium]
MKKARQIPLWPTARVAGEEVLNGRAVLAARVRGLRTTRHLSQATLAERAGMHRTYLSSIERGRRNVPLDTVCRLAWALGVDVPDLFTEGPGDGEGRPAPRARR